MRIYIEDLPVVFPYPLVFNEQIEYMTLLKRTLDSTGHALLEMPTGTGKTICLLALLTSYLTHRTKYKKVLKNLIIAHLLHKNSSLDVENFKVSESFAKKA